MDEMNSTQRGTFSRRSFLQLVAGLSLSSASGAWAGQQYGLPDLKITDSDFPKIQVKTTTKTASQRHNCKPDLARFPGKHMAFKVISEELGAPSSSGILVNQIIKNVKGGKIGKGVPVRDPLEARMFLALNTAATTWNMIVGPYGENHENMGFLSWLPQGLPPELTQNPVPLKDKTNTSKKIKAIAAYAGSDKTGITRIDRRWVYSSTCKNGEDPGPPISKPIVFKKAEQPKETENELILPESVQYAVVMLFVQPWALHQIDPATLANNVSVNQGYSQMGLAAVSLAQAIRSLGYVAIPCMNDTAMSVPLAIDAGFGELGRLGFLITPEYGPNVRIAKVLTNMPMAVDSPIEFGVTNYCRDCGICARECPSGAISPDKERTFEPPPGASPCGNPGSLKWYVDGKKCLRWWLESGGGCSRCINVCPYTRMTMGRGGKSDRVKPEDFWDMDHNAYGRREIIY
ncbi:MAG: reductive dehalogenase [Desulfobacterales bacterium]|nr:reductive dehalogenase [Desulfobacterales bacterium]